MRQLKHIPNSFCWCLEMSCFKADSFGNSDFRVAPCIKQPPFGGDSVPGAGSGCGLGHGCGLGYGCAVTLPLCGKGTCRGLCRRGSREGECSSPLMITACPAWPCFATTAVRKLFCFVVLGKMIDYVGRLYYKMHIMYVRIPEALAIFC